MSPRLPRLAWALVAALALPIVAQAQDLSTVWQAALQHDHQLAAARAGHGASRTLRDQADALWRPQLGLNLGLGAGASDTAMRGARFSAPAMGPAPIEGARFSTSVREGLATRAALEARQPLIDPQRDAQKRQLQRGADMGDLGWRAARAELMLATAQRYFALALAEEERRLMQGLQEAMRRSRDEAHDRYQLGAAPITDTHEADAALAEVQARLAAAELALQTRRDQLAGSTGLAQASARLPLRGLAIEGSLTHWLQLADADNPQLQLAIQATRLATDRLDERAAAGKPTLDLVAQASHQRLAGHGAYGSARNRGVEGMVGIQLQIPLSTGGMVRAQTHEAAERVNQARAELDLVREQLRQQVRAAWQGLQAGDTRISALEQRLTASQERLAATRLGLEVGDRTTLDLLNAENELATAELALVQARSDQVLTQLRLAALGDRLDESWLARVDTVLAPPTSSKDD